MWYMVAQRLARLHPQLPHQINFGNVWKLVGLLYSKNTSKVSLNQCRCVLQRGSSTMAATLDTDSGRNYSSQKSINLIIGTWSTCYLQNKYCCVISCLSWCCIYGGQQCTMD
ncbi:hypothetical protein TNCV_2788211 [Trichonephila clavipes]|uniref:Uncharacterized protein n=1 Tax=Trichonephila clavipes TaxID=2585209 RepID=A0A8X6VKW5_TRICX|nr:hypothetical protein TNCV_2788211 [Trichonephila clavipes]